ncbi:glutamate receptor 2 [Copidosoma floridanum]|uniref:glutamate receptor 2 n=1 Tax=Copidosoma floridanum TaxID=29053 RepID=UPI0006C9B093|nr:glutamate receptor 2 [Copidosoma floridanum]
MREKLPPFPSHISITTINDFPYSEIINKNGTLVGRGLCFDFFHELMKKFNFTYTIVPPEKDVIGDSTTGMIKQLYKNEVDMAVSHIPIIPELAKYVDFSDAIELMDMTFLIPRPGTSATGTGLFAPFSERVWWAILFSIFIIGPAIYIIIILRSRLSKCEGSEKFTFFMCLWWAYGALVKQGTIVAPPGDSIRISFSFWWIYITILSSFYTANLTAFFTLNKFTLWINSIEDLLYWRYSWWIVEGRSVDTLIQHNDPAVQPLITSRKWGYGYTSTDYNMSFTNILKHADKRVFIVDRTVAMLAIQKDYINQTLKEIPDNFRCRYAISDKRVFQKLRGYAFPKKSILRNIMVAFENGFVEHYRNRMTSVSQVCPLDITMIERQLKVSDLYVTYKVCFYAYSAAGCLWALEVLSWLVLKFAKCGKFKGKLSKVGQIEDTEPRDYGASEPAVLSAKEGWPSRSPPPSYEMSTEAAAAGGFQNNTMSIQGREYDVVHEGSGARRLIPSKNSTSNLFQYLH